MSAVVGADSMGWRYDPIFIDKKHSVEWHISEFEKMAENLAGYTKTCVISFIDIYKKVERNFPEAKSVRAEDRAMIGKAFVKIASKYGMVLRPCAEGEELAQYGADCSGCMTVHTFETALHSRLEVPKRKKNQRNGECACLLGTDIGALLVLATECLPRQSKQICRIISAVRHYLSVEKRIKRARQKAIIRNGIREKVYRLNG